jgi:tetratricopeptide (TPR) repeat protein
VRRQRLDVSLEGSQTVAAKIRDLRELKTQHVQKRLATQEEALYRQVLIEDPTYDEAHYNLGNVLDSLGDVKGAIECYKNALAIQPKCASTLTNLGLSLVDDGDQTGAMAALTDALKVNPHFSSAINGLGGLQLEMGQANAAISTFTNAIKISPMPHANYHSNLGTAYLVAGDFNNAACEFKAALKVDPSHPSAREKMRMALQGMVDLANGAKPISFGAGHSHEITMKDTQKLLRTKPVINSFSAAEGDGKEAIKQALAIEADTDNESEACLRQFAERGEFQHALVLLQDLEQGLPASQWCAQLSGAICTTYGEELRKSGSCDAALMMQQKAISFDTQSSFAYNNLACALIDVGINTALAGKENDTFSLMPQLELKPVQAKFNDAVTACQQALAIDREYARVYRNLGNAYLALAGHGFSHVEIVDDDDVLDLSYRGPHNPLIFDGLLDAAAEAFESALTIEPEPGE